MNIEFWITIVALIATMTQLWLQRMEIVRGNKIEQLRLAREIILSEIQLREKIISYKKSKKDSVWDQDIQPHITKVNDVLRPNMRSVEKKIIAACGGDIRELKELPQHYIE